MKRPLEWFLLTEGAKAPTKAYGDEDACYDLYSAVDVELPVGMPTFVDCGIGFNLSEDQEVVIRGRSSMALKAIWCHVGTVDSGWRGAAGPILLNLSKEPFLVKAGDKICQAAVREVPHYALEQVTNIRPSARAAKGFGSSGK